MKPPKTQESEILDRLPPNSPEAEAQTIGAILLLPPMLDKVASIVKPTDFYDSDNATIFHSLVDMSKKGVRIDPTLLMADLRRRSVLVDGMAAHIGEAMQAVGSASNAESYAKIVLRASRKRQILQVTQDLLRDVWHAQREPEESLAVAEAALAAIQTGSYETDPVSMETAVIEAMEEIDDVVARRKTLGFPIGIPQFDTDIGGVFGGELTIIAARPSQGKTSLALQAAAFCASQGRVVYFATLEMDRRELATKRLCSVANVSNQRVRSGAIGTDEQWRLSQAAVEVGVKNLHLHDWPEIRPYDLQRAARRVGAQMIFVDYLQYVTPPDATKKRYEQVGDISRELKTIARQLQVPVVACAQIGRQADQVKESRPKLSHLRESGNIENDADLALLLWRPEAGIEGGKGTKYEGDKWSAELEIGKNRKGETKKFRLDWDGGRTLFSCHGSDVDQTEMF